MSVENDMQEGAFGPDVGGVEDPPHCVYADTDARWASVHDRPTKRSPTGRSNPDVPSSTLRRHLPRLAAGVSVAAATSALSLLAAAPAQAATPVTVTKALGTVMRINGSDGQESLRLTVFNGAVTVSNTLGSVQAGSGCVQLGAAVKCDGVHSVGYNGNGGDDSFRNDTSLLVSANLGRRRPVHRRAG